MAKVRREVLKSVRKKSGTKKAAGDSPPREPPGVDRIANRLLSEIRSLQFAQEETSKVLTESADKHRHAFGNFLNGVTSEKNGSTIKLMIPVGRLQELRQLLNDVSHSTGSLLLSRRGLFLVLVSKWDAYFGSLLRWAYRVRPEIIDSSSRTISFAELKKIDSIDMARSKIVEDEIGVVLRDSHDDQFEYLERKLSVSLKKLDIWPKFIELTQRRNLIAHADGKVSEQYLKVCGDHKIELDSSISLGSDLGVSTKYLNDACNCLAELGFKLSQVLWRKLQPTQIQKADGHLIDTTYEMVKAGQYELAIKILTFSLAPPMKFSEARDRYVCVVNLALAFKWMKDEKRCAEIIGAEDWSAAPLDLRLALSVLKDDFDQAVRLMKQIGDSGDISKENYQEWPLFDKFRRTKRFVETYRGIFRTEFEVRSVPPDVISTIPVSPSPKESSATRRGERSRTSPKPTRRTRERPVDIPTRSRNE